MATSARSLTKQVRNRSVCSAEPVREMVWNRAAREVSRMCVDTEDREQPVKPPSVHASVKMLSSSSGARTSIAVHKSED